MESRASRLLRGIILGSVATLLAALSHTWAGGLVPGTLALVLGGVFASAVGVAAVGRRRTSLVRTVAGVGIAQLAFHLVFSLLSTGGTVVSTAGHHHATAAILTAPADAVAQGGIAMWMAHLVAGVLTVAYLRRLEALVWALIARVGGFLVRVLEVRPEPVAVPRTLVASRPMPRPRSILGASIARRGPPVLLGARLVLA